MVGFCHTGCQRCGAYQYNMSSSPPAAPRFASVLIAIAFLIPFLYALYIGALGVVLPRVGAFFGLGVDVQGRLFPASFLGVLVGVCSMGILSDHWGRKPLLLFALALATGGMLLLGLSPWFSGVLVGAALIGAGGGSALTVSSALTGDTFPDRRATLVNGGQIAFGVGACAASPLLALSAWSTVGEAWQHLFIGIGAGFAVLVLLVAFLPIPRRVVPTGAHERSDMIGFFRSPYIAALAASACLYAGAEVGYSAWQPSYFDKEIAGGGAWAGSVVGLFWIAMTVGRILTGFLITRFDLRWLRGIFSAGVTLFALLTLASPTQPLLTLIFVALTALCLSGLFPLHLAEASSAYPRIAGTVIGLLIAANGIGAALLPYIIGAIAGNGAQGTSFRGALLLIPLATVLMVGLSWVRPIAEKAGASRQS